jgi:hypothetical protein
VDELVKQCAEDRGRRHLSTDPRIRSRAPPRFASSGRPDDRTHQFLGRD